MKKHLNKILFFVINILLVVIVALVIKEQDQKNKQNNANITIENSAIPADSSENVPAPVAVTPPVVAPPTTPASPAVTVPQKAVTKPLAPTRTTKKS